MKGSLLESVLESLWYQKKIPIYLYFFLPLSWIYFFVVALRRKCYQIGIFRTHHFSIPIIVVGNITVGGTGKTPLVMHIYELLKRRGFRPGIVSRGYTGSHLEPTRVTPSSPATLVGDEALLLVSRLGCPMVVGKNRVEAVKTLIQSGEVDIVISDDGLQHYALGRHIEIAVVDAKRRYGNGLGLPLGPLREPLSRLQSVDLQVAKGSNDTYENTYGNSYENSEYDMEIKQDTVQNALDVDEERSLSIFKNQAVHAVAGIGNPKPIFSFLTQQQISVIPHVYPDHYFYQEKDIHFNDNLPVIMTEKDAVKCKGFLTSNHWILNMKGVLNPLFDARLILLLQERVTHG